MDPAVQAYMNAPVRRKASYGQWATALRRDGTNEELKAWGRRYNPVTGKMDGDPKHSGWRGVLTDGRGGVMTEVSTGVNLGGKETEIPLIVPSSTPEELSRISAVATGAKPVPMDILRKAVSWAKPRIQAGKSPFYNGDKEDEALRRVTLKPVQQN